MGENGTDDAPEKKDAATTTHPEAPLRRGACDHLSRARWWLALLGLLAGLCAFGGGEAVYKLISPEDVQKRTVGMPVMSATAETTAVADGRNAALAFGILGACLGGFLGIAGGLARRKASAAVMAGLVGSILGSSLSAGASLPIVPLIENLQPGRPEYELILSIIMHVSIWSLIGAAAGLAFALGLGERRLVGRGLAAGIAGAVLGAIAFDLCGAFLFPTADTGQAISTTWPSRLLARLLVPVATAAVIILFLPASTPADGGHEAASAPP